LRQIVIASTTPYDIFANVLLFVPLGFGVANQLRSQFRAIDLVKILLITLGFSLTVEALQIFLPFRDPSLIDVVTNACGGWLGGWLFVRWHIRLVELFLHLITIVKLHLSLSKLLIVLAAYTALIVGASAVFYNDSHLVHWDPDFPLVIGNERTGDRPWNGSVADFYMADRTLSRANIAELMAGKQPSEVLRNRLLASYQFVGKGNYQDQSGQLPELVWQGFTPALTNNPTVSVSRNHWLATMAPVTSLIERIRKTSQFTLITTIATADTDQTGPARIISVSGDRLRRNFTLGQQNSHLIFRLRTPLSGDNGTIRTDDGRDMVFPDIFADQKSHRIILTYGGSVLKLYVDTVKQVYIRQWTPEIRFFQTLVTMDVGKSNISRITQFILKLIYYSILLVPIGLLLAILSAFLKQEFSAQPFLICVCIGLPPVLLEVNRVLVGGNEIEPVNLFVSLAIEVSTVWLVRTRIIPWFTPHIGIATKPQVLKT